MHKLEIPLPDNETEYENSIAKLADRILEIENPTRKIFDPWQCPVEFLPLLAWSLSVDVWDDNWDELQKRRVIAASPRVHRIKGTRAAIETALEAFGLEHKITEWWETEPKGRRGTFHVRFDFRNGSGTSPDPMVISQAAQMVKASKPKSRSFTISAGVSDKATLFTGLALRIAKRVRILPPIPVFDPVNFINPTRLGLHVRKRVEIQAGEYRGVL